MKDGVIGNFGSESSGGTVGLAGVFLVRCGAPTLPCVASLRPGARVVACSPERPPKRGSGLHHEWGCRDNNVITGGRDRVKRSKNLCNSYQRTVRLTNL